MNDIKPPQKDVPGYWLGLTASQMGAAHKLSGLPNQDSVKVRQLGPDLLVAAVADGHGHYRHFRSARGSRLAVTIACQAAEEMAERLVGLQTADQIRSAARGQLVPAIAERWREAVHDDHAAEPFTPREQAARAADDDVLVAYGSTLLLAIAGREWLVLTQIGDGDIVGIRPGGRSLLPVPGDPSLDGHQTTSLCTIRAEEEFRVGVVHIPTTTLLGVLLATDGYGNAQADDPWADSVSADLAELIRHRPPEWLAAQLPLWASRCASTDGSADDTTIALLIAPSAAAERPEPPTVPAGHELGHEPPTAAALRMADPVTKLSGEAPTRREQHLDKAAVTVHSAPSAVPVGTESPTLRVRPGSPPAPGGTPGGTRGGTPAGTAAENPTMTVRTKSPAAAPRSAVAPPSRAAAPPAPPAPRVPPGAGARSAPSGGRHAPAPARRSRRPLVIAAVVVVIAAVAAIAVTQLGSSSATPKVAPSVTAHASPAAGAHPSASAPAGTAPGAGASAQSTCTAQASGTGQPVPGPSAEMCDPATDQEIPVSLAGLPADASRIGLQVDDSIFVLDGGSLWWRPVAGPDLSWHNLGQAPSGPQEDLCSIQPGTVIAAAPAAGIAQGASTPWTQVTVPAQSPVHVGNETQVPGDPCGAGRR